MGFFDSEKYILSMYVAISIVTLLILFNFVGIFENSQGINNNKIILKDKIKSFTGFANLDDSENLEDENQISFKSYFIYYSIIVILGFSILLIVYKIFRG